MELWIRRVTCVSHAYMCWLELITVYKIIGMPIAQQNVIMGFALVSLLLWHTYIIQLYVWMCAHSGKKFVSFFLWDQWVTVER